LREERGKRDEGDKKSQEGSKRMRRREDEAMLTIALLDCLIE
jgi:hypothetical protein